MIFIHTHHVPFYRLIMQSTCFSWRLRHIPNFMRNLCMIFFRYYHYCYYCFNYYCYHYHYYFWTGDWAILWGMLFFTFRLCMTFFGGQYKHYLDSRNPLLDVLPYGLPCTIIFYQFLLRWTFLGNCPSPPSTSKEMIILP